MKIFFSFLILLLGFQYPVFSNEEVPEKNLITSFEECEEAGYPVMESFPRKCAVGDQVFIEIVRLNEQEAAQVAQNSVCGEIGNVKLFGLHDEKTYTWYFDIYLEDSECSPLCIVNEIDHSAKIEWECNGEIPY